MTPTADRVSSAQATAAEGTKVPPLRRLQAVVADPKALAEFLDWSASPFGTLVVGALRDLALWGPPSSDASGVAVQYGVTEGLSLAARLLEDPSAVISKPGTARSIPDMDFKVSASDVLDMM